MIFLCYYSSINFVCRIIFAFELQKATNQLCHCGHFLKESVHLNYVLGKNRIKYKYYLNLNGFLVSKSYPK